MLWVLSNKIMLPALDSLCLLTASLVPESRGTCLLRSVARSVDKMFKRKHTQTYRPWSQFVPGIVEQACFGEGTYCVYILEEIPKLMD